jgi:hypothetical protein
MRRAYPRVARFKRWHCQNIRRAAPKFAVPDWPRTLSWRAADVGVVLNVICAETRAFFERLPTRLL